MFHRFQCLLSVDKTIERQLIESNMESGQPPKKLTPAEYAEMVKTKLRNTYPSSLNPMGESVINALKKLLAEKSVKLKNEQLEEQFKTDLIHTQLKWFDELWDTLQLSDSLVQVKQMETNSKTGAPQRVEFGYESVKKNRMQMLEFRVTTLEEKIKEQQNALRGIFEEVEQKRENYDSIMKRREKLVEVMKSKYTEMDESLNGLKERRSRALENELME